MKTVTVVFFPPNSSNHNLDLDVNECETLNGGCDHQCNNTPGSFNCKCRKGFSLDGNGKTCIGKFEINVEKVKSCLRIKIHLNYKHTIKLSEIRIEILKYVNNVPFCGQKLKPSFIIGKNKSMPSIISFIGIPFDLHDFSGFFTFLFFFRLFLWRSFLLKQKVVLVNGFT